MEARLVVWGVCVVAFVEEFGRHLSHLDFTMPLQAHRFL